MQVVYLQTLLLGIGIVMASIILAVGGLLVVRRSVPLQALRANHEVAPQYLTTVGVVYALVVAFALSIVWSEFNDANNAVEREANRLVDLGWLAAELPDDVAQPVRDEAMSYARAVVDEEWARLAEGAQSRRAAELFEVLRRQVQAAAPADSRQTVVHEQMLIAIQDISDLRHERLARSRAWVPRLVWALLIMGGMITVGSTYFFGHERTLPQVVLTVFLAGTLGSMLFLIAAMDNPFWGAVSASPAPFLEAAESLARLGAR